MLTGSALSAVVSEKDPGKDRGHGLRPEEFLSSALSSVRQVLPNFLFIPNAPLQAQIWMLEIPHNFWLKNVDGENLSSATLHPKVATTTLISLLHVLKKIAHVLRMSVSSVFIKLNK